MNPVDIRAYELRLAAQTRNATDEYERALALAKDRHSQLWSKIVIWSAVIDNTTRPTSSRQNRYHSNLERCHQQKYPPLWLILRSFDAVPPSDIPMTYDIIYCRKTGIYMVYNEGLFSIVDYQPCRFSFLELLAKSLQTHAQRCT